MATPKKATTTVKKKTVVAKATTEEKQTPAVSPNYPAIILAEIVGTFVLTFVAVATLQQFAPLYVGLTVAVLVMAIGAISGGHLNPAVTFGLWASRRLKASFIPVYWLSQFVGAVLAVILLGAFSGAKYALDFSSFTKFDLAIVGVEVLGAAVFLFGLVAVTSHATLSAASKAFGVGISLAIALIVSTSAYTYLRNGTDVSKANVNEIATIPRSFVTDSAVLNPAVALAINEKTVTDFGGAPTDGSTPAKVSRFGLETIIGALVGAAIGANLYVLLAYANRQRS